jgi:hypothetical protein
MQISIGVVVLITYDKSELNKANKLGLYYLKKKTMKKHLTSVSMFSIRKL